MTRVVLIGAGRRGSALLQRLRDAPTIALIGVAEIDPQADGLEHARALGIAVSDDWRSLLAAGADLIVDTSGDAAVAEALRSAKGERTEIIGAEAARVLVDLLAPGSENRGGEERYRLALRELQAYSDDELIVGRNPQMRELSDLIARVAPTPTTVLIRGESGTGKELVARAIHRHSAARDRPLVTINCTALPPTLLESELFGSRRGAFTGAYGDRMGLFEKADGGTMFLDEIGDMAIETQAKLLRTLQTGEIRAVGDVRTRKVNVRFIAATNRNLERAIAAGEFREDLLYRVNTFTLALPPLRDRIEDLALLAEHFLQRARAKVNKRVDSISSRAISMLEGYAWPGNLRELENVIERAVVLTSSTAVEPEHLPLHVQSEIAALDSADGLFADRARALDAFERSAIIRYLQRAHGNVSRAAQLAKIPRRTLHRLLLKHHLTPRSFCG